MENTLLIADANDDFRLALMQQLNRRFRILSCRSGKEALDLLRRETPDVFVLDLMLPELDGLTLLETAVAEGIRPPVLAFTPVATPYVQQSAVTLGIAYLITKPCDIGATVQRITDLGRRSPPVTDLRSHISRVLLALNIATRHNGYAYLIEAIELMEQDMLQPITKVIYPTVARRCGCRDPRLVERSIRNALKVAWSERSGEAWQQLFPDAKKAPSNGSFITRLATQLHDCREQGII